MSNSAKGREFAEHVGRYLARQGHVLEPEYAIEVGLNSRQKKSHRFNFGSATMLVECKQYDWTSGGNNPSAKISTLNEAMMYLHMAPKTYRKLVFIAATEKKGTRSPESFAEYYMRMNGHFIPDDMEVWELRPGTQDARRLN